MRFLHVFFSGLRDEISNWTASQLLRWRHWRQIGALLLIGVSTALASFAFERMVRELDHAILGGLIGYDTPLPGRSRTPAEFREYEQEILEWQTSGAPKRDPEHLRLNRKLLFLFPAAGGLLVGLICMGMAPRFQGDGTEVTVHAIHHHAGSIPLRISLRKLLASVITATVGSSGQEGPITQAGAGVASAIARRFRFDPDTRRRLVIAGIAAGVGALFRVPLGGALYAVEILYRDNEFETDAIMPAFIGSIVSYSVFCPLAGEGWGALFLIPEDYEYSVPLQLLFYALLSVILAVCGIIFAKFFRFCGKTLFNKEYFARAPWARPMTGGLLLGLMAYFFPFVLGSGYGYLQGALLNEFTLKFCLMMAVLKIIATCVTLGSGNAGGLFAPSIVIGGMLGAVGGMIGQAFGIIDDPAPVVLVGMAGFFGGVSKTPIATLIMVTEMTLGYGLLVPLMTVTALTYLLIPRDVTICGAQVANRKESPAHRSEYIIDVLRNLRVVDILRPNALPPTVRPDTTLSELNMLFTRTQHEAIPVINEAGELDGILLLSDIKEHLLMLELGTLVLAADLARHDFEPIHLDEDASQALGRLLATGVDELPVISEDLPPKIVGAVSRRDIIQIYHRQMTLLSKAATDDTLV